MIGQAIRARETSGVALGNLERRLSAFDGQRAP
jgi:hypothetical protein